MTVVDITNFSTDEMLKDRLESLNDIVACECALEIGVTEYSGGSIQYRLDVNRKIVEMIETELDRRGVSYDRY